MYLPNVYEAVVDEEKIIDYLLSETHPVGKYKTRFLKKLGYNKNRSQELKSDIQRFAETWEVAETVETRFGMKYIVSGTLKGPTGVSANIRTVWIIEKGQSKPRFITAYPCR